MTIPTPLSATHDGTESYSTLYRKSLPSELPDKVQLQPGVTIMDLPKFIESHLSMVEAGDEPWREVYRYRLEILREN